MTGACLFCHILLEDSGSLLKSGRRANQGLVSGAQGSKDLVGRLPLERVEVSCRFLTEDRDFLNHAGRIVFVIVLRKLFLRKVLCVHIYGEPCEEERVDGIVEELVLRYSTVLVHGFAHNAKVNQRVCQEGVVLVMPVSEN